MYSHLDHKISVLIALASSEGSSETVHMRSLARTFAARMYITRLAASEEYSKHLLDF